MYAPRERASKKLGTKGPQLFLSYSSTDKDFASRLAQNLNACGVDVWFDEWELRVGDELVETLADAVAKSRYVGVVVGPRFDSSRWTKGEVNQALTRERTEGRTVLLPLLLGGVTVPASMASKRYLGFSDENYFSSLVELAALIHNLNPADIAAGLRKVKPRRMAAAVRALGFAGFDPDYIVDSRTLKEVAALGGEALGNNRLGFDPKAILRKPGISPALQDLMRRVIDDWGLG